MPCRESRNLNHLDNQVTYQTRLKSSKISRSATTYP